MCNEQHKWKHFQKRHRFVSGSQDTEKKVPCSWGLQFCQERAERAEEEVRGHFTCCSGSSGGVLGAHRLKGRHGVTFPRVMSTRTRAGTMSRRLLKSTAEFIARWHDGSIRTARWTARADLSHSKKKRTLYIEIGLRSWRWVETFKLRRHKWHVTFTTRITADWFPKINKFWSKSLWKMKIKAK